MTRPGPNAIILVLCVAALSPMLMQTVVIPLIPNLPEILQTDAVGASWVLTATLLTGAVAHPISGRVADLFGKRRMLLVCLTVVAVGAVISAFSSTLIPMLVGRALQGLGMGIIPIGLSLMRDLLPAQRLQSGAGSLSAMMGFGGALAMPLSAWVVMYVEWQWVFWFAAIQSAVVAIVVWRIIPREPRAENAGAMDFPGAAGFGIAMTALLVVITQGATLGWTSPVVLTLLIGGALILALWLVYEWRAPDPLVDLRLSLTPTLLWTNAAGFALGYALFVSNLVFPLIITTPSEVGYGLGLAVGDIGVLMMPGGLAMMLAGPMSGRLSRRIGGRTTMQLGIAGVIMGYGLLILFDSTIMLVVALVVFNVGIGLAYAALAVIIMDGAPSHRTGAANGLNALMRSVGMTVSSAVTGVVLAWQRTSVDGTDYASPGVMNFALSTAVIAGVVAVACSFGIPRPRLDRRR